MSGLWTRKRLIIVAWLAVLNAGSASANFLSGNDVAKQCTTNKAQVIGYVSGVFDKAEADENIFLNYSIETTDYGGSDQAQAAKNSESFVKNLAKIRDYCAPKGIDNGQVADIVCQFLNAKPAMRHMPAASLVIQSLNEAWPCTKGSKAKTK